MGGGLLGGPLRFPKEQLAVLLVQCDQEVLDQRCDERVDKMIQQGLLDELKSFHQVCKSVSFDAYLVFSV